MAVDRRAFLALTPFVGAGVTNLANGLTAAGHGASEQIDASVATDVLNFTAQDRGRSRGLYHRPAGKNPKTAVIFIHPRANMTQHFLALPLVAGGYGALGCASRWENNDSDALMEATLLDIAAALKVLKEQYRVERIVAIGHSGGGGLFSFYQVQATTRPPARFASAPSGDPPDLNQFDLPPLDGLILLNAHKGEGLALMDMIDPAVADESDPMATLSSLDMYDRRNGYRQPPESSTYTPEFRAQYRAAQQARHRRLDAKAYALLAMQKRARKELESPSFAALEPTEQVQIRRTSLSDRYLIMYRTNADLKFTDLSIDPSDRHVQANPEQANYVRGGRAQIMTPRGFLSTWSGFSSRMVTDDNLAKVTVPALMVVGTADSTCCGLEYYKTSYAASIAKDKQLVWVKGGDHSLVPTEPTAGGRDTQAEGARAILEWLRARFPA